MLWLAKPADRQIYGCSIRGSSESGTTSISKRRLAVLKPTIEIAAQVILLASLAAALALFALHATQAVRFRYPLDYGEAPLVDQAMRLAAGESIYRPDLASPPYTISNYPPLYPLVLALPVAAFGPSFAAGRLISILCTVLTALLLAGIAGRLSREPPGGRGRPACSSWRFRTSSAGRGWPGWTCWRWR